MTIMHRINGSSILNRLADTSEVLRGGSALFEVRGDALSRREWRDYVAGLDLAANLPWVLGFGYSPWLTPAQRESRASIRDIRAKGLTAGTIRPTGERPASTPIIWLEPFTEVNRRAIGYDMYAEPLRRAAMDRARDTGLASIAAPIILAQDREHSRQAHPDALVYPHKHG